MSDILIQHNPITPSSRFYTSIRKDYNDNNKRHKNLVFPKTSSGGRDNKGHITSRFRGSGHKTAYRKINFQWLPSHFGSSFEVIQFEYDPNRNVPIALIKGIEGSLTGKFLYIIRPEKMEIGNIISVNRELSDLSIGSVVCAKNTPVGTNVHCIELKSFKGAQLGRSAGASIQIVSKDKSYVLIKLPSGEVRKIHENCLVSIGSVSNKHYNNRSVGKAGRNRWCGKRPHVRGVAMNPVDHPHGGGEGKTAAGRHPVTPWGKKTKGLKTRKNKNNSYIVKPSSRKRLKNN